VTDNPAQITLEQWNELYSRLQARGVLADVDYMGPLRRHVDAGDVRLRRFLFDNSPAALRLWNFLLSENERLFQARDQGKKIVGAMKDLGTSAVMAYCLPGLVAFYPDGAWWIPCIMGLTTGDLAMADRLGVDESFCPVRAMLGAFVSQAHFPRPDLLLCSTGATCDDFSAIAQRLAALGYPILWWEIPHRRRPDLGELAVTLPGGFVAPQSQVRQVRREMESLQDALAVLAGEPLSVEKLRAGIGRANMFRRLLNELRTLVYTASPCPMGALEMLIVEMLAIHFCSDQAQAIAVVEDLLAEVRRRVGAGTGVLSDDAVKVFWVNPVADLRVMNLLEQCAGRLCGTEFLFSHALDEIPEDIQPLEALARSALADPMVGPAADRAKRICRDCRLFGAQAVVISRIPNASHCAMESGVIAQAVRAEGLGVIEIEVPPVSDSLEGSIKTRLQALIESARQNRPPLTKPANESRITP
jgi:benzoyl-CoA reductase/2-hydroxyglutaryl-CoA dehydratase subunit BcrC/BadD/HgdB